jgi:hypothetical protein
MDAFTELANAAVPNFADVVGYSMTDFVVYAKALVSEFIAGPIVFVIYNRPWVMAWIVILVIVAAALRVTRFLNFTRPARR